MMKRVSRNPYAAVDWDTWTTRKAQLHTHTTESDGGFTPAQVIDRYHDRRFDILAITDHDTYMNNNAGRSTWPWTDYGRDPDTLGMLAVRGNEFSDVPHAVGLFTDMWLPSDPFQDRKNDFAWILNEVGERDGLLELAHPSRSQEVNIHGNAPEWFVTRMAAHSHLLGIEIHTMTARADNGGLTLWDPIITDLRTQQLDLPAWGYSVDDSHIDGDYGLNYQLHPMPALTEQAMRDSLTSGAFFSCVDPLGNSLDRHAHAGEGLWVPVPTVTRITVTRHAITLDAHDYASINWVTSGGVSVGSGEKLQLDTEGLGLYVRAVLTGSNSELTYTQPFYLEDADGVGWTKRGEALAPADLSVLRDGRVIYI